VDLYFHFHLVPSGSVLQPVSVLGPGACWIRGRHPPPRPRVRRDFMRSRRGGRPPEKFFMERRNLARGCALTRWNGLYDPLSSFVPVLEPRPRRGFSFGARAAAGCATAAVVSAESAVVGSRIPEPGSAGRHDVWPGSGSGEVSFLLSSVIIAVRGRPF
jgi:hypothetical protein